MRQTSLPATPARLKHLLLASQKNDQGSLLACTTRMFEIFMWIGPTGRSPSKPIRNLRVRASAFDGGPRTHILAAVRLFTCQRTQIRPQPTHVLINLTSSSDRRGEANLIEREAVVKCPTEIHTAAAAASRSEHFKEVTQTTSSRDRDSPLRFKHRDRSLPRVGEPNQCSRLCHAQLRLSRSFLKPPSAWV